ncbi:MAG TPA: SAM-dependent chlorinase/fluorinase [Thermoplasmata archaeon]|nr:SAM-dependent chlorinase/fluorinase [Thermoplasmata archaeon]
MTARLVTLTTDVGPAYAAQIKGVLYRCLPPGHVVDLVDDMAPYEVAEAAFLLRHMGARFPRGTVHLAIVDPGVGGRRAPIAVACRDGSYLVGPDNGLLDPLAQHLGIRSVVRLDPRRIGAVVPRSRTFEGRDLFAPAAARLALGSPIRSLGAPAAITPAPYAAPVVTDTAVRGRVVHVDRFGNLITDIPPELVPREGARVRVQFPGRRRAPLLRAPTYEAGRIGQAMLVRSSFDLLEVSVREGNAARRFRIRPGDPIAIGRRAVRYR